MKEVLLSIPLLLLSASTAHAAVFTDSDFEAGEYSPWSPPNGDLFIVCDGGGAQSSGCYLRDRRSNIARGFGSVMYMSFPESRHIWIRRWQRISAGFQASPAHTKLFYAPRPTASGPSCVDGLFGNYLSTPYANGGVHAACQGPYPTVDSPNVAYVTSDVGLSDFPSDQWVCIVEEYFQGSAPDADDGIISISVNDELKVQRTGLRMWSTNVPGWWAEASAWGEAAFYAERGCGPGPIDFDWDTGMGSGDCATPGYIDHDRVAIADEPIGCGDIPGTGSSGSGSGSSGSGSGSGGGSTGSGQTANPGTISDFSMTAQSSTTLEAHFTSVDDGTGSPAKVEIRYANTPIEWGSATRPSGTCEFPIVPSVVGQEMSCTITGVSPATTYDAKAVSYRGTQDSAEDPAVFGAFSDVASATTPEASGTVTSSGSGGRGSSSGSSETTGSSAGGARATSGSGVDSASGAGGAGTGAAPNGGVGAFLEDSDTAGGTRDGCACDLVNPRRKADWAWLGLVALGLLQSCRSRRIGGRKPRSRHSCRSHSMRASLSESDRAEP